jgi:hypothetical protein
MLKSVLMAASRLPASQIPTPHPSQYYGTPLNMVLENTLNSALTWPRQFI